MSSKFCITREKHLDHMVKVVPIIVVGYAIQCYFIVSMGPVQFAVDSLMFLGGCLGMMIAGFITYDLKHKVEFFDDHLEIHFGLFNYQSSLTYHDIKSVSVSEKEQSFATLTVLSRNGKKFGFYFIDDADKIKQWLEEKRSPELGLAA